MKDYRKTKLACYLGFVTQAIVANFTPLLFMAFHREYGISIASLALIPAVFYVVQLLTDFLCAKFKDIDYRKSIIVSEVTSALGLAGLAFLPGLFPIRLWGSCCASASMPWAAALSKCSAAPSSRPALSPTRRA